MTALQLSSSSRILLKPDAPWISLLDTCSEIEGVKQIHTNMIKTGLVLDTIPASRLLSALCEASSFNGRSLNYALQVFDCIQEPNTFMWNTIIRALASSGNPEEAVLLYCQMLYHAVPHNPYTFPFLLKACASLPSGMEEAQQIHCQIIKGGFACEVHAANSLLNVYVKSGYIDSARILFDRMSSRDTVTWNTMISGYTKSGRLELAHALFDMMETKNVISWTTMITGYLESCCYNNALEIFRQMQMMNVEADTVAFTSVLTACAHLGALDQGRWIHTYIKAKRLRLDSTLGCVLVDMYAKCGELDEAKAAFIEIREKNVSVWTAMITGLAVHGLGREALDLFTEMEKTGLKPNQITFTSILTACSYAGLVEEGRELFERIQKVYAISPSIEHYGCMVDLLGRAGMLKEAEELVMKMPFEPNAAVWGALLNACRIHRDFELGKAVGKVLIEMDGEQGGRYIQLAGILQAERRWNEAVEVRKLMKERGVMKLPGCSLISLNGNVHEFVVEDRS